jgi:uncharacterized protein DUF4226
MTQPAFDTDKPLSGRAAAAVVDMHEELRRRLSGLNSAEAQLAEVLLAARATTAAGRARLDDIQRQLIEAINNPVNALDSPAGERHFLLFLRGKVAEIQRVLDEGMLSAEDEAELARALGDGYLLDAPSSAPQPAPAGAPPASAVPATGMTSLPQSLGGLTQAASPLAGLASLLSGGQGHGAAPDSVPQHTSDEADRDEDDPPADDADRDADTEDATPATPEDAPLGETGPAETRPASS